MPSSLRISLTTSWSCQSLDLFARHNSTHPLLDTASIPAYNRADMVADDLSKLLRIRDGLDPPGQLRVPDQSMSPDNLAVISGPVRKEVSGSPIVRSLRSLERAPFHGVLARDLAKIGLDNGGVRLALKETLIGGRAEKPFASGDKGLVDGGGRLTVVKRRRGQGCYERCAKERLERLHFVN